MAEENGTEAANLTVPLEDLRSFSRTMQTLTQEAQRFSVTLSGGLKAALVDGKSLQQVVSQLALTVSSQTLTNALRPVETVATNAVNGWVQSLGAGVSTGIGSLLGQVTPFAHGGVVGGVLGGGAGGIVDAPSLFAYQGAALGAASGAAFGLAGEAGAEAILPLARGRNGRLGVQTQATGLPPVTINVAARDVQTFLRSEAQVSAMVARAVGRGRRGL